MPVPRNLFRCRVPRARTCRNWPKPQRIHHRNRPRPHCKNIPQNSAHSRSRALKRLYKTRMVMRLNLENRHHPVADIHHARIFPRPLHHVRPARRQPLQMHARRFIRAVLAPHHAENSQLRKRRIAPQYFLRARVFFRREAVLGCNLRSYFNFSLNHFLWA